MERAPRLEEGLVYHGWTRQRSEIMRRGLRLVAEEEGRRRSALDLAGRSVGRFRKGPKDLSTNRKHLEGFGE